MRADLVAVVCARGTESLRRRPPRGSAGQGAQSSLISTLEETERANNVAELHIAAGCPNAATDELRTAQASIGDEMCLTPVEDLAPEEIREIRLRENASQAVFARYLNVTTGLVSQWERGEKRPRGASLKLLTLVAKNGLGAVA